MNFKHWWRPDVPQFVFNQNGIHLTCWLNTEYMLNLQVKGQTLKDSNRNSAYLVFLEDSWIFNIVTDLYVCTFLKISSLMQLVWSHHFGQVT